MIVAIVLGAIAVIALAYMFLGSSSSTKTSNTNTSKKKTTTVAESKLPDQPADEVLRPISDVQTPPAVPEAGRNIFAFYIPPTPTPAPAVVPTPIPTPPPPIPNVVLSSISPVNVYAHTGDFNLDVTGDKFTPETRIYMGGAELQTRFISPQQLSTKVPAQLISFEGGREVKVQSRDGKLFSNTATLNVMPAPVPNFVLVGVITRPGSNDTGILREKNGKELLNVQRGDLVGGRFRVTSISVREVVLTDTAIQIKHKLPLVTDSSGAPGQMRPQTPPPPNDDDTEP